MLIEQTAEIAAFNEAMAKAQAKMSHAEKDRTNTHFGSKYATLASVIEAIRGPLTSEGIAFLQWPSLDEKGQQVCVTRLALKDQWIEAKMPIVGQLGGMQQVGSAYTYARRYSLMMLAGIAGDDDDDDGEGAQGRAAAKPQQPPPRGQERSRGQAPQQAQRERPQRQEPAQGGGQAPPPVEAAAMTLEQACKAIEDAHAAGKGDEGAVAFAAWVDAYARGVDAAGLEELASVCSKYRKARLIEQKKQIEHIGAAIGGARERLGIAPPAKTA